MSRHRRNWHVDYDPFDRFNRYKSASNRTQSESPRFTWGRPVLIPQRRFRLLTPPHNEMPHSNTGCVLALYFVQRCLLLSVKKLGLLALGWAILRNSRPNHFAVGVPKTREQWANKRNESCLTALQIRSLDDGGGRSQSAVSKPFRNGFVQASCSVLRAR